MNISNKVTVPALAGAVVVVLLWVLGTFANVAVPGDVASALTVIVMAALGYVVPHGGDA